MCEIHQFFDEVQLKSETMKLKGCLSFLSFLFPYLDLLINTKGTKLRKAKLRSD